MLTSDVDRYYTPTSLACRVVDAIGLSALSSVIDSACGAGRLLDAAQSAYPEAFCVGIDNDTDTIRKLKRQRPRWGLITGDALDSRTWQSEGKQFSFRNLDVAVLNPPFSMGSKKGQVIQVWGARLRCSLAMAHILTTLEQTFVQEAIAIVPESLGYSDLDGAGRALLEERYNLHIVEGVKNSTFNGARANALIIKLSRSSVSAEEVVHTSGLSISPAQIVRGGLPVFEAKKTRKSSGILYAHTTTLPMIAGQQGNERYVYVKPILRGVVKGPMVLLPRVGLPRKEYVSALDFKEPVQLSDCLISIQFNSFASASNFSNALRERWDGLVDLYRGTGARYVTVARLTAWLCSSAGS